MRFVWISARMKARTGMENQWPIGLWMVSLNCSKNIVGEDNIVHLQQPSLGAEDFAFLVQDVPGTMFRLGVAGEKGCAPLHNGFFSLDERSLEIGIKILCKTIIISMQNSKKI